MTNPLSSRFEPVDEDRGLRIRSLALSRFRNYESFGLDDVGALTVFVGPNGVGKTNILEAIQLMTAASSFRNPQISQLIKEGHDSAHVRVVLSDDNRQLEAELVLEAGKKRYSVNGKAKKAVEVRGTLPAVAFTPDDLNLVKKSSSVKRDALDDLGVQLARNYAVVRSDYEKTLRFKNRLLKEEAPQALVDSIDESLLTCGSQLFCYRSALFARMVPLIRNNYAAIAGEAAAADAGFTAKYRPSWDHLSGETTLVVEEGGKADREEVRRYIANALKEYAPEERRRARSLVGPHNDKVEFSLAGRDAANFASQGQQRSIVLAWKLAEVEVVRQSLEVSPVLLLDDVMSELDATRRDMLVRFVTDDIQTFITATDLSGFNEALLSRARVVELWGDCDT